MKILYVQCKHTTYYEQANLDLRNPIFHKLNNNWFKNIFMYWIKNGRKKNVGDWCSLIVMFIVMCDVTSLSCSLSSEVIVMFIVIRDHCHDHRHLLLHQWRDLAFKWSLWLLPQTSTSIHLPSQSVQLLFSWFVITQAVTLMLINLNDSLFKV